MRTSGSTRFRRWGPAVACAAGLAAYAPASAWAEEPAQDASQDASKGKDQGDAQDKKDAQDKNDTRPARPELPPAPPPVKLPWGRHIEVGGDLALVARPASTAADGQATSVRYQPAIGFGVHARWEIVSFLRFTAYFVDAHHTLRVPAGGLTAAPWEVSTDRVATFSFGARIAPTLRLNERARSWISGGIGYGRFEFGKMTIHDPAGDFVVRQRAMSFAEIPLGIGASVDLIKNWLAIEVEVTGAFALGQEGESVQGAQAIDSTGQRVNIGGLPKIDASFVQTLGLSLVL